MYQLQVTVPIIPEGGYIKITLDSTKITTDNNAHCRVGTNFARSGTDSSVLRCYRVTDGFIIAGFPAITAGTNLQIFFHAKSTT